MGTPHRLDQTTEINTIRNSIFFETICCFDNPNLLESQRGNEEKRNKLPQFCNRPGTRSTGDRKIALQNLEQ
jgi:hypothetical protein